MHKVRCFKLGFWDNYVDLCTKNGKTPNGAAEEIGISSGSITAWKKGRVPIPQKQKQIADYFGVTVDYLLNAEKENAPVSDAESEIEKALAQATPAQRELISSILDMNENQLLFVKELVDKAKKLVK